MINQPEQFLEDGILNERFDALLAVPSMPPAHQTRVVGELLLFLLGFTPAHGWLLLLVGALRDPLRPSASPQRACWGGRDNQCRSNPGEPDVDIRLRSGQRSLRRTKLCNSVGTRSDIRHRPRERHERGFRGRPRDLSNLRYSWRSSMISSCEGNQRRFGASVILLACK